jgi:hypothetical protein
MSNERDSRQDRLFNPHFIHPIYSVQF